MTNTSSRWLRLKLALAKLLLRKTNYLLVKREEAERVWQLATELQDYAAKSGALNDPRKIMARKRVLHFTDAIVEHVDLLAGVRRA